MKSDRESGGPESISVSVLRDKAVIANRIHMNTTWWSCCHCVCVCVCVSMTVCVYVFPSKSQGSHQWEGWGLQEWLGVVGGSWWLLGLNSRVYFQYCIASCHKYNTDTHTHTRQAHSMGIVLSTWLPPSVKVQHQNTNCTENVFSAPGCCHSNTRKNKVI